MILVSSVAMKSFSISQEKDISQFSYSKRDQVTFVPSANAAHTFETPIDQVVGSAADMPNSVDGMNYN